MVSSPPQRKNYISSSINLKYQQYAFIALGYTIVYVQVSANNTILLDTDCKFIYYHPDSANGLSSSLLRNNN